MNPQEIQRLNRSIIDRILNQLKFDVDDDISKRKPKNVILLTAEYLPRDLTSQALQCKSLAEGLVNSGINTHVVCFDPWKAGQAIELAGVNVHYIGNSIKTYSPLTWAMTLGMEVGRVASDIHHETGNIDLIHAHEWTMFPSALNLQAALRRPLLVNYYSVQDQRTPGVSNEYTEAIKQLEWRASEDSKRIIVNENWMKNELLKFYSPPSSKVNVVPPKGDGWTNSIARDYSWVMNKWWDSVNNETNKKEEYQ